MKSYNLFFTLLCSFVVAYTPTAAQDGPACCKALAEDPESQLCPDRAFALLLPRPIVPQSLLLTIEHRALAPAFDHPIKDGLGLDNGSLKIGIGLRYSPLKNLDAGIRRVNNGLDRFDTYELDGRYCFLTETQTYLDAAVTAGTTVFYQDTSAPAAGYSASLLLGKSFFERWYVSSGCLGHSNSTYATKTVVDKDWSVCVPVSLIGRVVGKCSVLAEVFVPVAGYSAGQPGYAYGFKYATWRHSFSVLLTNTQYTTIDGVVTGSNRTNKPVLGFMITRKFGGE